MAHPTRPARTYLESLDSVRGASLPGDTDDLMLGLDDLHVFTEALLTLALGRQIVVPQPYAFDSVSFLWLAAHVLSARPKRVPGSKGDRPLGWHAHGAGLDGIDAALAAMIARDTTSENPFHSSAWPQLNGMSADGRKELAKDPLKGLRRMDPSRAEQLEAVIKEFRRVSAVEVLARETGRLQLADMVGELRDGIPPVKAGGALDDKSADVLERLSNAARALVPNGRTLSQRSLLRLDAWPWDPDGRPPVEVVGSSADFDLFVEFVDTAYNRTIAEAIGNIQGLFSTAIAADDDRQRVRGIAQGLALRLQERGAVAEASRPGGERGLAFEVLAPDQLKRSHARELANVRWQADQALAAILSARGERSQNGKPTPFWSSVEELNSALASGNVRNVEHAIKDHSRVIGSILGSESREARLTMQTVSGAASGSAGAYVGFVLGSEVLMVAAGAAIGAVGAVAPLAPAEVRGRLRGRRVASAVRGSLRIVEGDHV